MGLLPATENIYPSLTEDEISEHKAFDTIFNDQCIKVGSKVLGHMSTTNVARYMERICEALGEEKLNFYGFSYGTFIAMMYANLYPNNVGAFVLDGNLDPISSTNLDCQVTIGNADGTAQGAQDTLDEFILQCNEAQPGNCPLANDAGDRLYAVLERLKTDPITLPIDGSQYTLNYPEMIAITHSYLYSPLDFLSLAELFVLLEEQNPDQEIIIQYLEDVGWLTTGYDNIFEQNVAVSCSDSCTPTDHQKIFEDGKAATAEYGIFGEYANWGGGMCASWTSSDVTDKYTGPFTTVMSTPVLVVGNLYDPATPYQGAVINNELLQNSILLTVDTPGHTALDYNECADENISEYLANPIAYAESWLDDDPVCQKDRNYFDYLATPTVASLSLGEKQSLGEFRKKSMRRIPMRPFKTEWGKIIVR